jgi:PncC family amidohydrolase|tara:strand:- start:2410 stop:2898 length:489 start_codon:yes stop_codon:yes gene_type:complete
MNNILDMVDGLKNLAISKKIVISTAESCTGGLISKYLTDLPGSSNFYNSSIIVYSNNSKINLLNVNPKTLLEFGAVSEEVVKEMSKGLLEVTRSNIAIAISGIMSPDSDDTDKDVGTLWICVRSKDKEKASKFYLKSNDRSMNREHAAEIAIKSLYDFINQL